VHVTRDTHGEEPDVSVPAEYRADHPDEHPEDWGWHGEFGKWADVAGWVVVVILLLMMTATHYNRQGTLFLGLTAGALAVGLVLDHYRRRNAWRK
jgi:hypothetical protein